MRWRPVTVTPCPGRISRPRPRGFTEIRHWVQHGGDLAVREPAMNDQQPWQWPEATWREMVGRARAGRSLRPATWPNGARCAVAISFDADHETIPRRDNDPSPMRISQGQYGNRQAMPRIRKLLERESVPATFFYPAVSALLHPEEGRASCDDCDGI